MLRVLVVTIVHTPHDARIFRRQIGALNAAGHDVTYAAPWTTTNTDPSSPPDAVRALDLPRAVGVRRWRALRAARRALARIGPSHDVILLHDPELVLAVLGQRNRLPPIVLDIHEDTAAALIDRPWVPGLLRPAVAWTVRRAEAWAERHMTLLLAERSYQQRFDKPHLFVPNLPPLPTDDPPPPGAQRVVYVGRIAHSRGAKEMLELARRLPRDLTLHLIGSVDANVRASLEVAVDDGALRWDGFLPNEQALRAIDGALVGLSLIAPQPNHAGSLQTKVLEYLSRRVPVITSDLPVTGPFVRENGIGMVVDHGDIEAVLEAIMRLRDDPDTRCATADRGFALVRDRYNWEAHEAEFVQALEVAAAAAPDR